MSISLMSDGAQPKHEEVMPLSSISGDVITAAMRDVLDFVIGFVKAPEAPGQAPELLGSGTLVVIGGKRVVLTASHVITHIKGEVPQEGRLGLLLVPSLPRITIAMASVDCRSIAKGKSDPEGPDLGAIILSTEVAASIAAKKSFYNMDTVRREILDKPPPRDHGFWFVSGFPATEATRETDEDGEIVRFMNLYGVGAPDEGYARGGYDYYKFPIPQTNRDRAPKSFGGMSGGGFWQIRLRREPGGALTTLHPLLSGVTYFQIDTPSELALLCHGRKSIYEVAYDAIAGGGE